MRRLLLCFMFLSLLLNVVQNASQRNRKSPKWRIAKRFKPESSAMMKTRSSPSNMCSSSPTQTCRQNLEANKAIRLMQIKDQILKETGLSSPPDTTHFVLSQNPRLQKLIQDVNKDANSVIESPRHGGGGGGLPSAPQSLRKPGYYKPSSAAQSSSSSVPGMSSDMAYADQPSSTDDEGDEGLDVVFLSASEGKSVRA